MQAGREPPNEAMLQVQRLQLELARIDREIQPARGQPGATSAGSRSAGRRSSTSSTERTRGCSMRRGRGAAHRRSRASGARASSPSGEDNAVYGSGRSEGDARCGVCRSPRSAGDSRCTNPPLGTGSRNTGSRRSIGTNMRRGARYRAPSWRRWSARGHYGGDRAGGWAKQDHSAALASRVWVADTVDQAAGVERRSAKADARVCSPRSQSVQAKEHGRLSMRQMQRRSGDAKASADQAGAGRRGGRRVQRVRLSALHRRARVSSSQASKQAVRYDARGVAIDGEGEGGGQQVRSSVRELPCRGGGGDDHADRGRFCFPTMPRRPRYLSGVARSGVAQFGRCARLLTERLWVRVPPPELPQAANRSTSSAARSSGS